MVLVIVFTALLASTLLVIGTFLGKNPLLGAHRFSFFTIRWWWEKKRKATDPDDVEPSTSAHSILRLLQLTKPFPLSGCRGWRLVGAEGQCRLWARPFSASFFPISTVLGACVTVPIDADTCINLLRDLASLSEWEPAVLSSSSLQASPGPIEGQPDWDIVRQTARRNPLLAWMRKTVGLWWCLDRKWCYRTAVYHRYWYREENGCCWLVKTSLDQHDWIYYLAQPSEADNECILSVITAEQGGWTSQRQQLASSLSSFRQFALSQTQTCQMLDHLTLPAETSPNPTQIVKLAPRTIGDRVRALVRKSTKATEILEHGNETEKAKPKVPDSLVISPLVNGAQLSPVSQRSHSSGHSQASGNSGNSSSGGSKGRRKSLPNRGKLSRSATICEDLLRSTKGQQLQDWVESTANSHTRNNSTQSLSLSLDAQYVTQSNHCAAQIVAEVINASNLDLSVRTEEQARQAYGWTFTGMDKDVVVLKKLPKAGNSAIYSYIGKGLIKATPRAVWDAIRNPRTRFTYDDTLKRMDILHNFGNGLQIVHMHHEVSQLFKKETRDFCVLHGEKMDGERYMVTMSSVDWLQCPVRSDTVRGQFLSSGWIVEPAFKEGKMFSMVTYLSQVNLKVTSANCVEEIASRQPVAIAQLRHFLLPGARIKSKADSASSLPDPPSSS